MQNYKCLVDGIYFVTYDLFIREKYFQPRLLIMTCMTLFSYPIYLCYKKAFAHESTKM